MQENTVCLMDFILNDLKNKNPSMLHFEVWENEPVVTHRNYLGGNWFAEEIPENLIDPTGYLERLDPYKSIVP